MNELAQTFLRDGFVHLPEAVPQSVARECEKLLWDEAGYDPADPTTWTDPVHWVLYRDDEPFVRAINSPALTDAYDALVGRDRWVRRDYVGSFPLRFPHPQEPVEAGWHIDASFFARELTDDDLESVATLREVESRVNVRSRGRALLLLMLFSDVGSADAPTRIRVASHLDMPPVLTPYGDEGVGHDPVFVAAVDAASAARPVAQATGRCGDVYVCHPFLVHAAQTHRGSRHRFLAQPGIDPADQIDPWASGRALSPVEQAIRDGLT